MNFNPNDVGRKTGSLLIVAILGVLIAVGFIAQHFLPDEQSANDQLDAAISTHGVKPPVPLRIRSSGRLPNGSRGFWLGMMVSDAIQADSKIENYDVSKGKPDPADTNAQLASNTGGFFTSLSFWKGRLVYFNNAISQISPEDADQFDHSIFLQLGPPPRQIYIGRRSKRSIWEDGDIRIAYSDKREGGSYDDARTVKLEFSDYPATLESLNESKIGEHAMMSRAALIAALKHDWGDDKEAPVLKSLPTGFGKLHLLSEPWQFRAALPYFQSSNWSATQGRGRSETVDSEVDVAFFDDRAYRICEMRYDTLENQFRAIINDSIQQVGTASLNFQGIGVQSFDWEDDRTEVKMFWVANQGKQGRPLFQKCFTDTELYAAAKMDENQNKPRHYMSAPETKSFF